VNCLNQTELAHKTARLDILIF